MLRWPFVRARALAARGFIAPLASCIVLENRARGARTEHHRREHRARSRVPESFRPSELRASVRTRVAAAARRRIARGERSAVSDSEAARIRRGRTIEDVAAQTIDSDSLGRAQSNRVRIGTDARLDDGQ